MSHDFSSLEKLLSVLLRKVDAQEMVRLNRAIATVLRQSQSARIGKQENPDGSPYERRKTIRAKQGRIKRGAMFKKLKTTRYLKQFSNAVGIRIHFTPGVNKIAQAHQYGETERYGRKIITLPKRELLGITENEEKAILDAILIHLSK